MSSFISKSKKGFKPKAPQARRSEAPTSATASVRSSQEPSRSTPQPTVAAGAVAVRTLNDAAAALNQAATSSSGAERTATRSPSQQRASPELLRRGPSTAEPPKGAAVIQPPIGKQLQTPDASQEESTFRESRQEDAGPKRKRGTLDTSTVLRSPKRTRTNPPAAPAALPTPQATQQVSPGGATAAEIGNGQSVDQTQEQGAHALLQISQDNRRGGRGRSSAAGSGSEAQNTGARRGSAEPSAVEATQTKQTSRKNRASAAGKSSAQAPVPLRRGRRRSQSEGEPPDPPGPAPRRRTRGQLAAEATAEAEAEAETNDQQREDDGSQTPVGARPRRKATVKKTTAPKARAKRKQQAPSRSGALSIEDEAAAIVAAATKPARTGTRKTRGRVRILPSDAAQSDNDEAASQSGSNEAKGRSGKARGRDKTPSDAEETAIDITTQTLGDLPKLKIGRLGPREKKLRERDEREAVERREKRQEEARAELAEFMHIPEGAEREKAKAEKVERVTREKMEAVRREERDKVWKMEDAEEWSFKPRGRWGRERREDDNDTAAEEAEAQASTKDKAAKTRTATAGEGGDEDDDNNDNDNDSDNNSNTSNRPPSPPTYQDVFHSRTSGLRVVNGQIMADPGQRTLDAPEPTDPVPEAQEQTDIDRRTTEHSFSHREARGRWGPEKTALFYEGLRRWGTDFGMVATWVPGMSRNQVKRKFNMEERANLADVLDALKKENRIATTLEEIQAKRGRPLKDPGDWQRDVDRREEEMRRRARAEREEREERLRNRGQVPPTATVAGTGKQATPRQGVGDGDGGEDAAEQEQVATEADGSRSGGKTKGRGKKKGRGAKNAQPEVLNEGMF